jgi:hypothetical protein
MIYRNNYGAQFNYSKVAYNKMRRIIQDQSNSIAFGHTYASQALSQPIGK